MKRAFIVIATVFSLSWSAFAFDWQPQAPRFAGMEGPAIRKLLKDGPMTMIKRRTKTDAPFVTAAIIVEAKPHQVWKLLTDYKKRPQVYSNIQKVENIKWQGNIVTFTQHVMVKFSFMKFGYKEQTKFAHYPETRIEILDPNRNDAKAGGYELVSIDQGNATLFIYSISEDLRGMGFPVGTVVREWPMAEEVLISSGCLVVVTGVKDNVERMVMAGEL